ncbi:hypothetical protein STAN_3028 [Streptomyces sp. CBMAI 2042]|nr:hypothetical protein STAN_3028 [Streptomyces sp. CBMAI 2042]
METAVYRYARPSTSLRTQPF